MIKRLAGWLVVWLVCLRLGWLVLVVRLVRVLVCFISFVWLGCLVVCFVCPFVWVVD